MKPARTANIVAALLVAAWVLAGMYLKHHQAALGWLPKWSLTFAVLAPTAWIILYTVQGFAGHGKWWKTDVGTNIVWIQLAIIWNLGMILWAQWFNHGMLNTFWQAWAYIGGVIASGVIVVWRMVIWQRNYRRDPGSELRDLREENAQLRAQLGEPQG